MTSRMVGSVLTFVILLFSVVGGAAQTYTQMQWGMNKGVTPYAFGANINGTWRDLGTVSSAGVWSLNPSNIYTTVANPPSLADGAQITAQAGPLTAENMYAPITFGANKYWDNFRSVLTVPAGTQNINTSAYDCFLRNNNPSTVLPGPITVGAAVCYFGIAISNVDNSITWGQAMYLSDNTVNSPTTTTGRGIQGYEYDFGVYGNGTVVTGNTFLMGGLRQPSSSVGIQIGAEGNDTGTGLPIQWSESFVSRNGAAKVAFVAGASAPSGTNIGSQPFQFASFDGAGALYYYEMTGFNNSLYIKRKDYSRGIYLSSSNSGAPSIVAYSSSPANFNLEIAASGTGAVAVASPLTVSGVATLSAGVTVGVEGSTVGTLAFKNATSGTITLQPTTGALGTVTATLPANTGIIAETNLAQTFSATQTFSSGMISAGTTPTATGAGGTCAAGTVTGGALVGTVALTGNCVSTNTLALTGMPAATTGYVCDATDRTAKAVTLVETTTTTTSATFEFTASSNSGNVIQFKCLGY